MKTMSPSPDSEPSPRVAKRRLWLRIILWAYATISIMAALAVIALVVVLHSTRVHNYIIETVEHQASDSIGVPVELENYSLSLSTLSVDLYGLTVHGAAPYTNPPLLQVDHAAAGVRIVSIVHRRWYLDNVRIDRPIVRVFTDADGKSNIPTFKSGGSSSNTSIFDLGIRHAILDQGEVYYNDRHSALSADLHDVDLRTSFDASQKKYSGKLSYNDGHLVSGSYKSIPHNLDAEFEATPTVFHLSHAQLTVGPSKLNVVATVEDYDHPSAQAQYDIDVDGAQIRQILSVPTVPTGTLHASGKATYRQVADRSLIDTIAIIGDLSSQQLDVQSNAMRTRVRNIAAHYHLEDGNLTLQDLRAELLGGKLAARGTMGNIDGAAGTPSSAVIASLRGVSLSELRRTVGGSSVQPQVAVTGVLNAEANAKWGKTLDDLVAHSDVTIDGKVSSASKTSSGKQTVAVVGPSSAPIPIDSILHATYTASNKNVTIAKSYLRTPQTSLTMDGTVSDSSQLAIHFQSNDLAELESVAGMFGLPPAAQSLGLAGTASFQGSLQGTVAAPHLTGELAANNLHAKGTTWRLLHTDVDVSPSRVSLAHGKLDPGTSGHATFDASVGLDHWSFTDSSPIELAMDASQLNIADLEKIAGQPIPVTGTLALNIHAHGTELSPTGQGSISLTHLVAYDEPISTAKVTFTGSGDEVHADLAVQLPAGSVQSKVVVFPRQKSFTAQLNSPGIRLEQLAALKSRSVDAKGTVSLNGTGKGTFDNPDADFTLQIPQLVVQDQAIKDIDLHVNLANRIANANLTSSAVNTSIRGNAKINLSGDYLADASLDTQAIPLQPLAAIYAPSMADKLSGQTEIHATLHGPLKNQRLLEGHVTVPVLKMAYGGTVEVAEASPIHIDYKDQVISLQRSGIKGTDTDLQFQGSIPTSGSGDMSLVLLGSVNLALAQLFDPDLRSSGEVKFNINSKGPVSGSNIAGQIEIVDANLAAGDLPVGLQHGNGVLTLTKDRINIDKFQATVGGGTLTALGGVSYRPTLQFDLGLNASGIRALYPQGLRETVNADLRLSGNTDNAVLGGSVNLSDLSFTPAFDLNSFISQLSGGVASPPSAGFAQNLQLNVALRSQNDINLASRTLSVQGSANLQLRGTAAQPVILGRVNLNNGDIILNGDRFVLNGGTIEFVNPSETEPVVNVALNTTIQQYSIYLRFNGPVQQMRTNYSSDPALPAADIINLLAFGQTTEANSANPSTPANQAAESLVASQVSSQVTSRVSKIAGISQLSINPVLAGGSSQGTPGANITIQQRVTGNLFVTFSSNVASTQNQTISGQYQISPRVAVSATRDQNGGFAFDTLIKKSW